MNKNLNQILQYEVTASIMWNKWSYRITRIYEDGARQELGGQDFHASKMDALDAAAARIRRWTEMADEEAAKKAQTETVIMNRLGQLVS